MKEILSNFFALVLNVLVSILLLCWAFGNTSINIFKPAEDLGYTETVQHITDNQVEKIVLYSDKNKAVITLKEDETRYITNIPNEEVFCEFVQQEIFVENDLEITQVAKRALWLRILAAMCAIAILEDIFLKKENKKSKRGNSLQLLGLDDKYEPKFEKSEIHFSNVAGLEEEKEELTEIIDFFKDPNKYIEIGAKTPKGVLLSGPPGTGKTLLAKAVAGEADISFLVVSGSEFDDKYVGVGASRVRQVFEEAKNNAPCIIFIDEIDAIGQKRTSSEERWSVQTINQLLNEMDGFTPSCNIVVMAATNRPKSLDPALIRAGRFDRIIEISLPNVQEREAILKIHSKNKKFMDDVSFSAIAHNTSGFSGAELENLLNEAALLAVRKEHLAITNDDIDEAMKKVAIGLQKKGKKISEKERKLTAYHEAGHAVACKYLPTQDNVKEISIIPRGDAGGYTWHKTIEDKTYLSKTELEEKLIVLLGGRVAERIAIGDISTGASGDLEHATEIAKSMICVYGMDEDVGPISLINTKNELFGQETMSLIGNLITKYIKDAENKVTKILNEHRMLLDMVADALLSKETISGSELDVIFKEYQNNCATNV